MTDDASRFTSIAQHCRRLHSSSELRGRAFCRCTKARRSINSAIDGNATAIRYPHAPTWQTSRRPQESARYYRAACREIARSTDERTAIAAMLPPGVLCGHTISVERRPARRPNAAALSLVGVMNSFPFDWLLRQKAAAHVSLYILSELPVPELTQDADRLVAHAALRLCCNHRGFASLWREQLGDAWKEEAPALLVAGDCGRSRSVAVAGGDGCRHRSCLRTRPRAIRARPRQLQSQILRGGARALPCGIR